MQPITDITFADIYFTNRTKAGDWFNEEVATREASLIQASNFLRMAFTFSAPEDEETIQNACCEQALYLIRYDPSVVPSVLHLGMSDAAVGPISATFDKSFVADMISPLVRAMIEPEFGEFILGRTTTFGHVMW